MTIRTVGIIGAGKLGTALGRLSIAAGLETLIASRPSPVLSLVVSSVLPQAELVDWENLADLERRADVVILAVPATAVASLDLSAVRGTVVDATNPWEATGTAEPAASAAELHPDLLVARTLNHVSYEELLGSSRTAGQGAPRRAMAVLAHDPRAAQQAAELLDVLGFDAVSIPPASAELFRPDGRLFGAWLDAEQLSAAVV